MELARAIVDPWNNSACIPDGARGTGCFATKQLFTLATGTTGTCYGCAFSLDPDSWTYQDTGSNANSFTAFSTSNWVAAASKTTIETVYGSFRPIACGVKVAFGGSTNSDQGTLIIGQVDHRLPLSFFGVGTLSTIANNMLNYKIFPVRNGGKVTWEPMDQEDMDAYIPLGQAASLLNVPPRTDYILAVVFGAATAGASTCTIEAITRYEGTYALQTLILGNSEGQAKPSEPGWYEKTKSVVNQVPSIAPLVGTVISGIDLINGEPSMRRLAIDSAEASRRREQSRVNSRGQAMLEWYG